MRSKPCGAANEMRQRLAGLNDELRRAYGVELEMRVGINTGQVVAGRAEAGTFATGDAITREANPAGGRAPTRSCSARRPTDSSATRSTRFRSSRAPSR